MIDTERGCWRQRAKKVILFLKLLLLLLLMLVYFCLACRIAPISSGYKSPLLSLSPAFSRIRTVIPSSHIRCLQRFQSFSSLGHVHIIISHIYNLKTCIHTLSQPCSSRPPSLPPSAAATSSSLAPSGSVKAAMPLSPALDKGPDPRASNPLDLIPNSARTAESVMIPA